MVPLPSHPRQGLSITEVCLLIIIKGYSNYLGSVSSDSKSISVTGATTVDIFFDAETSYRYSSQTSWEAELKKKLDAAVNSGYNTVKDNAVSDHSGLMGRVNLKLGTASGGSQATDNRLTNFKNNPNNDPELVTLMFNFGRHLLISASRDTGAKSLPANLQGIWNDNYNPPWQSKYTININIEMNYWPAEVTNLQETHKPLFDLIDVAVPRGQAVASSMYGCNNGGWVLHHNTDLWGDAAPVDYGTPYMMWPMGGAWLSLHSMEHYRFTRDTTFLQERAWPLLRDAANFYYCYLFTYNGYYSTGPSLSPENVFVIPSNMKTSGSSASIDIAPTMDNAILIEFFNAVIETCNVLGITGSDLTNAKNYLTKIKPEQISSSGRIMEWRNDYAETDKGHRHMSHLFGLFPGSHISPLTSPSLSNAAKASVDTRMNGGSGSTGWSRTWAMNLYARLFQGETVWSNAQAFLQKYPSANLWNTDSGPGSAFQIDGNFGFVSAIAEMLLQSHTIVHILPALPSAVPAGSVTGLVARGNFVVSMNWSNNVLTSATIVSRSGGSLAIRVQKGTAFYVDGALYTGPITTRVGDLLTITLSNGISPTSQLPVSTTSTSASHTTTTSGSGGGCISPQWGQCDGKGWTGCKTCESPYTCQFSNDWYSQCL